MLHLEFSKIKSTLISSSSWFRQHRFHWSSPPKDFSASAGVIVVSLWDELLLLLLVQFLLNDDVFSISGHVDHSIIILWTLKYICMFLYELFSWNTLIMTLMCTEYSSWHERRVDMSFGVIERGGYTWMLGSWKNWIGDGSCLWGCVWRGGGSGGSEKLFSGEIRSKFDSLFFSYFAWVYRY